ncbi:MAG: V-type ATP synthase subunit E family protein [Lentisphaeria bacterium]
MDNQEEKLQLEILTDSKKQAEKIIAKAQNSVEKNLLKAQNENKTKREKRLHDIAEETDKECQALVVKTDLAIQRNWLLYREKIIADLFQRAKHQAENLPLEDNAKSLRCLAKEALKELGPGEYRAQFSPLDKDVVTEKWLLNVAAELNFQDCKFNLDPTLKRTRGIKFQSPDERVTFDNTFANRLHIMQNDFREKFFSEE